MQPYERVDVEPVPAWRMMAVDHDDLHVGMRDQRVRERHAGRAAANDEVVRLEGPAAHRLASA
jgi:hypothetical protein